VRTSAQQEQYLNKERFEYSEAKPPLPKVCVAWLITLLFPIAFSAWWLTLLSLLVFGLLIHLILRAPEA
jgi:hypothetical protein